MNYTNYANANVPPSMSLALELMLIILMAISRRVNIGLLLRPKLQAF
jgi:hypothetical protein